jgi:hypothetical protein
MPTKHRGPMRWAALLAASIGWACTDAPTGTPARPAPASLNAVKFWDALATTRWNLRATDLLQFEQPAPPNGQAWASRMLTYLSLAQYHAVLDATAPSARPTHASVSAAVARASVVVLSHFYTGTPGYSRPAVPATLEQQFVADQSSAQWPGQAKKDVEAGDAIGRAAGEAAWNQAQIDGYNTATTAFNAMVASRPVGESYWVAGAGTIVRSLWGVRPFFLEPEDFLLSPAPPGLAELKEAANEVYAIMTVGSGEQLAEQLRIANEWNRVAPNGPFTAGEWNRTADDLIRSHHRTEAHAARILAYANAAAFDAQIDCFTTKYTWWVPRPAQLNPSIMTAFATPNHPSYPSAHSCISSAFGAVLSDVFPSERRALNALVEEAGLSRVYAGIHYSFDVEVGQGVGRRAAAKALAGSLE